MKTLPEVKKIARVTCFFLFCRAFYSLTSVNIIELTVGLFFFFFSFHPFILFFEQEILPGYLLSLLGVSLGEGFQYGTPHPRLQCL